MAIITRYSVINKDNVIVYILDDSDLEFFNIVHEEIVVKPELQNDTQFAASVAAAADRLNQEALKLSSTRIAISAVLPNAEIVAFPSSRISKKGSRLRS